MLERIVVLGGGHGVSQLLQGLMACSADIKAVITGADNGGSTEKFVRSGMFPPGDLTRAALALAPSSPLTESLVRARSAKWEGQTCDSARNILLYDLWKQSGQDIQAAIDAFGRMVGARGRVIPSTLAPCELSVDFEGILTLRGEKVIDEGKGEHRRINSAWLEGDEANPLAIAAIMQADVVILGPGDLFTSIVPVLLVPGIRDALKVTRAAVVFVMNLMTKWGETHGFTPADFVRTIRRYAGRVDRVLANNHLPGRNVVGVYAKSKAAPVLVPSGWGLIDEVRTLSRAIAVVEEGRLYHHPCAAQAALLDVLGDYAGDGRVRAA